MGEGRAHRAVTDADCQHDGLVLGEWVFPGEWKERVWGETETQSRSPGRWWRS